LAIVELRTMMFTGVGGPPAALAVMPFALFVITLSLTLRWAAQLLR
jgi:hypothetical protein